jgi:hypothetical protein
MLKLLEEMLRLLRVMPDEDDSKPDTLMLSLSKVKLRMSIVISKFVRRIEKMSKVMLNLDCQRWYLMIG